MQNILFFTFLFFSSLSCISQKEDNIWVTGASIVFTSEFNEDSVLNSLYIDSVLGWGIYYSGGNTNICSSRGELLCSSDGMNVYHKNHHYMDGGYKLVPDAIYNGQQGFSSYSQTSIMLPFDSLVYLFTVTASDERYKPWKEAILPYDSACFDMLTYHIIDMTANGGLGKVVQSKIPLIQSDFLMPTEMMACRHANGRDWWLLKGLHNKVAYQTYLITKTEIVDYGRQYFKKFAQDYDLDYQGQCTFSSDGSMFASVIGHRGTVNLFDFDRCTGKLSNQRYFHVPLYTIGGELSDSTEFEFMRTVGIAFSPNQHYLYISGKFTIQQYEINNPDSSTAWYLVAKMDTSRAAFQGYNNIYTGSNGKMYVGNWDGLGGEMSIITNPNGKGANCGWCRKCMRFPLYYGASTPPCMPNYRVGALKGSDCDTIGKIYSGEIAVFPNPANDQIIVSLPLSLNSEFQYQILDMVGNKVSEAKSTLDSKSQFTINIRGIAAGMYVIRVINKDKDFVTKFVKR